jgi:hypothetical protein
MKDTIKVAKVTIVKPPARFILSCTMADIQVIVHIFRTKFHTVVKTQGITSSSRVFG